VEAILAIRHLVEILKWWPRQLEPESFPFILYPFLSRSWQPSVCPFSVRHWVS